MMRVYDCFPFLNEFELLKIRLRELCDVVDFFILVEGSRTHTGNPKPFHFQYEETRELFKEYAGKLIPTRVELPGFGQEPWFNWGREILQRSALNAALARMSPADDDIVLSSDVDEIPKRKVIEEYRDRADICAIEERTFHYNLNCLLETPTLDPKICRYRAAREIGVANLRYYHHAHPAHVIKDGGWHLSFMGGTDRIIEKMRSYAHYDERDPNQEKYLNRENVEASVRAGKSVFMREDIKYSRTNDFSDMPRYITENFQHFVESGWILAA
jgi:beta-1,4-mannosyl-glycoprotein beta-1,4-N-acetylglucosaminyltransferase